MDRLMKAIIGATAVGFLLVLLMSVAAPQNGKGFPYDELDEITQPEIPRLKSFSGEVFKNFAEFRVQSVTFNTAGIIKMDGEPFEQLVNINNIVKVHRFEDRKETDYSCLMYITEGRLPNGIQPILVRETYATVLKRMKKAIETR